MSPVHGLAVPPSKPRNAVKSRAPGIRLDLTMFKEDEEMTFSVFRLMQYHQKLDAELRTERQQRWPDIFRIQKLKRLKLAVKDRLAQSAARTFGKRLRLKNI
jgi:uncharacterized protein